MASSRHVQAQPLKISVSKHRVIALLIVVLSLSRAMAGEKAVEFDEIRLGMSQKEFASSYPGTVLTSIEDEVSQAKVKVSLDEVLQEEMHVVFVAGKLERAWVKFPTEDFHQVRTAFKKRHADLSCSRRRTDRTSGLRCDAGDFTLREMRSNHSELLVESAVGYAIAERWRMEARKAAEPVPVAAARPVNELAAVAATSPRPPAVGATKAIKKVDAKEAKPQRSVSSAHGAANEATRKLVLAVTSKSARKGGDASVSETPAAVAEAKANADEGRRKSPVAAKVEAPLKDSERKTLPTTTNRNGA